MTSRQLWKLLSGAALLVFGLLFGAPTQAGASTSGCAGDVVVALDVAVWSRPGHDTYGFTLSDPLEPGEWSVQASSYDAYAGGRPAIRTTSNGSSTSPITRCSAPRRISPTVSSRPGPSMRSARS